MSELGDLLYYMMSYYNDIDVQDKARFYYALLTGSTDRKVQSVLKASLGDIESMNQAITSLLPGKTEKTSLARIIQMEEQVFNWERISVGTSVRRLKNDSSSKDSVDLMSQYEEDLNSLQVEINIKCRLWLLEGCSFTRVHAVSIHVGDSPTFNPIKDRHIACLTKSVTQEVKLEVVPTLPLPLTLSCSVEFTSEDKQTYSAVLSPLDVDFSHLLMHLQLNSEENEKLKFSTLWKWVLSRKNSDRKSIESVKLFSVSKERFQDIHSQHLSKFTFQGVTDESDWCYAIFLPPQYHILLKCRNQSSDNTVVSIATDTWTLLPHIDQLLNSIFTC